MNSTKMLILCLFLAGGQVFAATPSSNVTYGQANYNTCLGNLNTLFGKALSQPSCKTDFATCFQNALYYWRVNSDENQQCPAYKLGQLVSTNSSNLAATVKASDVRNILGYIRQLNMAFNKNAQSAVAAELSRRNQVAQNAANANIHMLKQRFAMAMQNSNLTKQQAASLKKILNSPS